MKLTILFCEGPHDVSFIYRLLRFEGNYSDVSNLTLKKLSEQFPLLGQYFERLLTNQSFYLDSNLTRKPVLPTLMLKNKDTDGEVWIALYATEGNRQSDLVSKIIQDYVDELNDSMRSSKIYISLGFINDADKNGVDKELTELKKNYSSEYLTVFDAITITDNALYRVEKSKTEKAFVKQGYYIFCDESRIGKLEDIVLEIMQEGNENIFIAANSFLDTPIAPHKKDKKYDRQKSLIGSVGQLLKSGKTNTVIINDGCFLNKEKIQNSYKCNEIIKFINDITDI